MARRRYYYRRTFRPKQKWAINNVDVRILPPQQVTVAANANAFYYQVVAANANRVNTGAGESATAITSSAQILKTGRFKFKGCITNTLDNFAVTAFIAYVPEGYSFATGPTSDQNVFYQHPEWVIGWTRKDYANSSQSNEISITSRLKRNLNTGDGIIVGVLLNNITTTSTNVSTVFVLQGTLSYCCRAN